MLHTKSYKIARWFVIANYFVIPAAFAFAAFLIGGPLFLFAGTPWWKLVLFVLVGLGFLAGGIYSISIVPQLKTVVHVSDDKIVQEQADGTSTLIWWKEDFRVRHRPVLGRMELISPEGERIIKLEEQLEGYAEIASFVAAKQSEKRPQG